MSPCHLVTLSFSTKWHKGLLIALVAVALWLPRGFGLDQYATADEHAWLTRSANFYRALAQQNWAGTFQRHHPGVTITWAGTLGFLMSFPTYPQTAPREFGWLADEISPFLRAADHEPAQLLGAGRAWVVLMIVGALTIAFALAWRIFGLWAALAGWGLIAFDPFVIGHQRLMHLDGLLGSLMLLALLAFWLFFQSRPIQKGHYCWLILSAIAAGLAWLTRSPGFFLAPFLALLAVIFGLRRWWGQQTGFLRETRFVLLSLTIWGVMGWATFVLLWPAMWVDPIGSITQVLNAAEEYASEGHSDPIFFNGQVYTADPGATFYPISFLWRATPSLLGGLLLAVLALMLGWSPLAKGNQRQAGITLLLYALLFGLFMNLGAKKFDRYLVPAYLPLDLLAGLGWVALIEQVKHAFAAKRLQQVVIGLVGAVMLLQADLALSHYPYYLSYYNPLLGDSSQAVQVMQIGRGEGADQAARLLNARFLANQPGDTPTAASAYTVGPFSYFYRGRAVPLTFWHEADYLALYTQDWQRRLPSPRQIAYFESLTPEAQIVLHGIEYARIYSLAEAPLPPYMIEWGEDTVAQIQLVSYELPDSLLTPGEPLHTTFYFVNRAPIRQNLSVAARLVDAAGNDLVRAEGWPWGAATSTWQQDVVWPDGHDFLIPADAAPGYYRLELGFYEPESKELLWAKQTATGAALPELAPLDFVRVGAFETPALRLDPPYQLGENVVLAGYTATDNSGALIDLQQTQLQPGQSFTLALFWQARGSMTTDYTGFVHVVDGANGKLTQHDQQPLGGFMPTSLWHRGQQIRDAYPLQIPADAQPGDYRIFVGMYDLATNTRLPIARNQEAQGDALLLATLGVDAAQAK